MKKREFHFFVAVWGEWHVDIFLGLNLPTLLAPNNLPYLAQKLDVHFYIATSKSDALKFYASSSFSCLKETCYVKLHVLSDAEFGISVQTQMRLWLEAVELATARGAFMCPFPADMVWADGSFRTIADLLVGGKKSIYAMFPRVIEESFSPEIRKLQPDARDGVAISVSSRELMGSIMRHIHPLHAAYLRTSNHFPAHAEYVYWPVEGEGMLMRSTATTVLVFDAKDRAVDGQFSLKAYDDESEIGFVEDSDDLCGASITPLHKDWSWFLRRRRLDIDDIGRWWINFDGAAHVALARRNFRFHVRDCDEEKWRRVERAGDFVIRQSLASREIMRVAIAIERKGSGFGGRLLASAIFTGRLRRHWRWRPPFIAFVPLDAGLTRKDLTKLEEILSAGNEANLDRYVLDHVTCGKLLKNFVSNGSQDVRFRLTMLSGQQLDIEQSGDRYTVNGHSIVGQFQLTGDITIYFVDGLICVPSTAPQVTIESAAKWTSADLSNEDASRSVLNTKAIQKSQSLFRSFIQLFLRLRRLGRQALRSSPPHSAMEKSEPLIEASNILFKTLVCDVADKFIAQVGQIATPSAAQALLALEQPKVSSLSEMPKELLLGSVAHINGLIAQIQGNESESMSWFETALQYNLVNCRALRHIGEYQWATGKVEEAEASFTRAVASMPLDRQSYRSLGEVVRFHNPSLAANAFFRAVALGIEIEYKLPVLGNAPLAPWYFCGTYRNFNIFQKPGCYWVAYLEAYNQIDLQNFKRLIRPSNIVLGLIHARGGSWRRYSSPLDFTPDSKSRLRSTSISSNRIATLLRSRARNLIWLGGRFLWRFLWRLRKPLIPYKHLWGFAIVATKRDQLLDTIDSINDDWIYR